MLADIAPDAISELHDALLSQAGRAADGSEEDYAKGAGPMDEDGDEEEDGEAAGPSGRQEHVLLQYYSSRTLRRLVLYATEEGPGGELARQFSARLWKEVLSGRCKQWVGTHGEKVLAAVVHADPAIRKAAAAELAPLIKPLALDAWLGQFVGKDHHLNPAGSKKVGKAAASSAPAGQAQPTKGQGAAGKGGKAGAAAEASAPVQAKAASRPAAAAAAPQQATPKSAKKAKK